jgi:hypothetical protein
MIDLQNLSDAERAELSNALRKLPKGTLLRAVDWNAILKALKPGITFDGTATVADALAAMTKSEPDYGQMLKDKLAGMAERLAGTPNPWDAMTPTERARAERIITRGMRARLDLLKRRDEWTAKMVRQFGDHRFDTHAKPWPSPPPGLFGETKCAGGDP